jgi:subtilisin-like proprotein convertase family protein
MRKLEHVQLVLTTTRGVRRGSLEVTLTSPLGTPSALLVRRPSDSSSAGFAGWTFMTTRCWDETPVGKWKLEIDTMDVRVQLVFV